MTVACGGSAKQTGLDGQVIRAKMLNGIAVKVDETLLTSTSADLRARVRTGCNPFNT